MKWVDIKYNIPRLTKNVLIWGEGLEEALCALMFNVMGYLHELLKRKEIEISGGHCEEIRT